MTIEDYLKTLISVQLALIQIKNERAECHQSSKVCANDDVNSFVNIDGNSIHEANNIMSTMDCMDQSSTISLHTIESFSSPISPGKSSEKCDAIYISNCLSGVKSGLSKISIDLTSSRYLISICSDLTCQKGMPADYVNEILKIINFKLKERETKINVKLAGVRVDNLIFSYLTQTLTRLWVHLTWKITLTFAPRH